jgi:hypothetical protein
MASQTGICNRALEKLGEDPIVSIDDGSKQAQALKRVYTDTLNALLVEHPWHFAKKRAALPASATVPAWGFNFGYPVPADFLRLLAIKDGPAFSLEADPTGSQIILCDQAAPLAILYLYAVADPGRLPPSFVEALSSKLGFDICEDLTQSNTKKEATAQLFSADLAKAKRINGAQQQPDAYPVFSWLASREQIGSTANPILTTDGGS